MSARSTHRILKVARTIADLADNDAITTNHLREALSERKVAVARRSPATGGAVW
ncbi:MAG: hypothetical protein U1F34_09285 [Gammaproteobacteria bacterium]